MPTQLLKQAPEILKYCQAKGYNNVGVLKFRVKKGQAPVTDNVGPLNLDLAEQLELALVLANRVQAPLGIVHQASTVAATIPSANHVNTEGRPALFTKRYPLAWGKEQVTPDAFLTGVVQVSDDLQQLEVGIVSFDRAGPLEKVATFTADADPFALVDSGESFLLRGALADDEQQLAQVVVSAHKVRTQAVKHPLEDPTAPVDLEIRYDNNARAARVPRGPGSPARATARTIGQPPHQTQGNVDHALCGGRESQWPQYAL